MDRVIFESKALGTYSATSAGLDYAIAAYLPASAEGLRAIVAERAPETDWTQVRDVGALLIILADFDAYLFRSDQEVINSEPVASTQEAAGA